MISIFTNINMNFLKWRYFAWIFSGLFIVVGVVALIINKGPVYGIDFTGGTLIHVKLSRSVVPEEVRFAVEKIDKGEFIIQKYGSQKEYIIKTAAIEKASDEVIDNIVHKLQNNIKSVKAEILRIETVGPRIGKELQEKALLAILISMIFILIYVWIRFDFKFGVGAIVALVHDAFITFGILTLLNKELSIPIIAALLTIVGYSINDSIVVSDRIRENIKKLRSRPFIEIVNKGINDVLSRTIITSLTTLFVAFALWVFGSSVIKDFALTLIVGFTIGTYSSIFIVSPIVVEWDILTRRRRSKVRSKKGKIKRK